MNIDGTGLRKLPLIPDADVDNYDACYLPDGSIVFCSTASFAGVPCVNGTSPTCNLYRLHTDGTIRQLTYEQDQDWCPTVLNNGRLLYLRWEYTDIPHAMSRILFHANPDGTNQLEYYGSGSYWPGSMFFAKPIPNDPNKFVAIVGGHHELPRMGDLVLFDPTLGRRENTGAVQRIPGRGRTVEPQLLDLPIVRSWPKFLHPYPLDEHFYIVSAKPSPETPWGVYLVDTFDNMVLLYDEPGYAMLEPIPIRKTAVPPVIPDRTDPARDDAEVFIANIYEGEGLQGVSPGSVKSLRLFSYQFSYRNMGAEPYSVGLDGPWDPRRIIGTVPINDDGSAYFRIPAYTPISIQPLDAEGKAIQQMRSWLTAMPGEVVSCVGCHESQNTVAPPMKASAAFSTPDEITPWYGPTRGFSFVREVQPVLDKYCIECHYEGNPEYPGLFSFEETAPRPMLDTQNSINLKSRFSNSYFQLRRFVRAQTKEGPMQVPYPREYHADTSRVVQLLQKGHHGVELDAEAWDRLIVWIDLNAPFHGNWRDIIADDNPELVRQQFERRHEMRRRYAETDSLLDDDPNVDYPRAVLDRDNSIKAGMERSVMTGSRENGYDAKNSVTPLRSVPDCQETMTISLGEGVDLKFVSIPAGRFRMGQANSFPDEQPRLVTIEKSFFMATTEITNEQFAQFDPTHDSRIESGDFILFSPGEQGWSLSHPTQPVVRVSWNRAVAFCDWLSQKSGKKVALPTEAQWEYAAGAGVNSSDTPFWYGTLDTNFSPYANLSDINNHRINDFGWPGRRDSLPAWRPADTRFDDHSRVSASVGSYAPNPFGLFDMHGNVSEWTADAPTDAPDYRIVKGGSWYDPPHRARTAFKQKYLAGQQVFDVGFRVIVLDEK
ncbi:MAG: SUMF1/EgtB/PvdO family nonheme iron enzyme, partial [Planctomycetaceae bacterium]|nr:SUMF1/EgtB/PvdO family nonheme iron enzyme [Planctomycetaceae bacterium]